MCPSGVEGGVGGGEVRGAQRSEVDGKKEQDEVEEQLEAASFM
jgi:hypothetical protein